MATKTATPAAAAKTAAEAVVSAEPSRRMHYPYTMTAKIFQFPLKYHFQTQPVWRYYIFGIIGSIPLFWSLQKLARCPENIRKWDEIHEKQKKPHHPWDD